MKVTNSFHLTNAYQEKTSQQHNESRLFLKKAKIKNSNDILKKYDDLEVNSSRNDSQSKKFVFLGALMFMAAFTGGVILYGSRSKSTSLSNSSPIRKPPHGITHAYTPKKNITISTKTPPGPVSKQRREVNTIKSTLPTPSMINNVTQIEKCAIKDGAFTYEKISKPLTIPDFNNLDLASLGDAVSLFSQRCQGNIAFINTILSQPTHLFWRKLQLIFPFMSRRSMRELLTDCKAQILAAKEKINNHDLQFVRCENDGSLGHYMGGMLRKSTYQLGVDTMVYTNDLALITDPFALVNTVHLR